MKFGRLLSCLVAFAALQSSQVLLAQNYGTPAVAPAYYVNPNWANSYGGYAALYARQLQLQAAQAQLAGAGASPASAYPPTAMQVQAMLGVPLCPPECPPECPPLCPPECPPAYVMPSAPVPQQPIYIQPAPIMVAPQTVSVQPFAAPIAPPMVQAPAAAPPVIAAPAPAPALPCPPVAAPIPVAAECDPLCGCPGFYAFGDFFQWDAFFPMTPYAATFALAPGASAIASTDFDRSDGFRAGAGWRFAGGWDLGGSYLDYSTNGASTIGALAVGTSLVTIFDPPPIAPFLGTADVAAETISLDMQVIDGEVGRRYCVCPTLIMRPFFGVRYAELSLNRNDTFTNEELIGTTTQTAFRQTDIEGIGPRAGAQIGWRLGTTNFQVFGKGAGSLLWADYSFGRTDTFTDVLGATSTIAFTQDYEQIVPILELEAGLQYNFRRFYVAGGWQTQNWFNVVSETNFDGSVNRGDLGTAGWFVRAGYNF